MDKFICKDCGYFSMYCEKWDAYYCHPCNKWLEEKCTDARCEYCPERPERPMKEFKHDQNSD